MSQAAPGAADSGRAPVGPWDAEARKLVGRISGVVIRGDAIAFADEYAAEALRAAYAAGQREAREGLRPVVEAARDLQVLWEMLATLKHYAAMRQAANDASQRDAAAVVRGRACEVTTCVNPACAALRQAAAAIEGAG